ncbi:hypothetical protein [Zhihengliuella halotolerans]|uniref:Uncharacterized protein n=1 Tax=Zhihengliuella halotolerans TaxID=370736 RepID=A0A4Q8ADP5_9MICC|nr:hypothetical protein [Zhihengliuella halotolerans]RZU61753.1 hypothetical protein EV380_1331 [Zhihengliuella halotolerans]
MNGNRAPGALCEVIICVDRRDGAAWAQTLIAPPGTKYVYVTPRSPDGVRGRRARAVHVTERMRDHPRLAKLKEGCAPALVVGSSDA